MTTADRWTQAVRERLGLGRLLPLGGPGDGAWIAERAVRGALLAAAGGVPGVRAGALRVAAAEPGRAFEPVVPSPPSALPPGPLRVTADFAATVAEPLPATAARLRTALLTAADELGLTVTDVDLRATELLEAGAGADDGTEAGRGAASGPGDGAAAGHGTEAAPGAAAHPAGADTGGGREEGDAARAADAALAVPGVSRLTAVLGRPVDVVELSQASALPRRHVRVELAVRAGRSAAEPARQVRTAVSEALPDHPSVAVVVTAID
ncbi:nucleopolyhedrovirus P10 family protein [Streptomyces sp. UC1A3]